MERTLAIKLLPVHPESVYQSFRKVALLRHDWIAAYKDLGESDDQTAYVVREFVEGKPLSRQHELRLFAQVLDALQWAHDRGVVHANLKLSNVLVTPRGGVRVVDFRLPPELTVQSDLVALGRMLCQLIDGGPTFDIGIKAQADFYPSVAEMKQAFRKLFFNC